MSRTPPFAVIRADAGAAIGMGHVMRSLALGEGLVDLGWRAVLATAHAPRSVVDAAQAASIGVHAIEAAPGSPADAEEVAALDPHIAVVDGYRNSSGFFERLTALGCRHGVIDDNVETRAVDPDVVINQNPHADPAMYAGFPRAELLLGLRFALVRRDVTRRTPRQAAGTTGERAKVLISMGGSDPLGLTIPLIRELGPLGADLGAVAGPANPRADAIRSEADAADGVRLVESGDYLSELADAACAVVGAGSTLWEAAYLGVPTVGVIVADNQAAASTRAEALGFTCTVDARTTDAAAEVGRVLADLLDDPARLSAMSLAGRRSVDGHGVERVAEALAELAHARQL